MKLGLLACALLCGASIDAARAGTATTTLGVTLTISAGCTVSSVPVAFGPASTLTTALTANGTVNVTCTNTTPYTVGLDQGTATGATVTTRGMTGGGAVINYALYRDSGYLNNWGKTIGTDTQAGTGNGNLQALTVYGKVPVQTSQAPGSYADVVNVSVNF
jgi:spore coat protein U-like protein